MTKHLFRSTKRITKPLELIYSDVCDLKFVQTRGEKKYFITFIDDCTRYCYVYLVRSIKMRLKINYTKIKAIRSDRSGEYDYPFEQVCFKNDIIHQTTAPYQSNGIVK